MEVSDIRIFRAVANQGSITKAADELGYVQSNITARIRQLEAEMNTQLFYRHPRGVTPTTAGEILLTYGDKILALITEAEKAVKAPHIQEGKLHLGIAQTISLAYHSAIVKQILETSPAIDVSVMVKHSEDLATAVLNGTLDFALITGPVNHPDLLELKVAKEEIVLVSHPAGNISSLADFANHTVLLTESPCAFRKVLESLLAAKKINPPKIMEYGTPESLLTGVMEGVGVSLLPRSAVQKHLDLGTLQATAVKQTHKSVITVLICQRRILPSPLFDLLANTLKVITGYKGEFL